MISIFFSVFWRRVKIIRRALSAVSCHKVFFCWEIILTPCISKYINFVLTLYFAIASLFKSPNVITAITTCSLKEDHNCMVLCSKNCMALFSFAHYSFHFAFIVTIKLLNEPNLLRIFWKMPGKVLGY